ncbi:FliO/MopB family protein [Geosporobacter ferrireducens]|uniref:Flagellar protein n=1 Tax=Geosporobacter ferrireducens TaxID=1424294 RepID=A0A1D8GBJ8_9FIRM|nr:flagellar biosynthetic protein FliO [Geosporobacter ferrireducens]AOT68268.1 hypothetical protein Gferi_00900 [Geosporobacter ferrireducens]MTI57310.1 flagellar biosynthetic protein FliO [Geosporobacter ferrireducens]
MILTNIVPSALITQQGTGNTAFLFVKLISYSFIFLMIVAAAYFTTRYVGRKSAAVIGGRNIQIIEKVVLGLEKSLYIVKVGERFFLLAAGKQNVELLTEVRKEEINQAPEGSQGSMIFPSFDTYLKKFSKKQPEDIKDHELLTGEDQDTLQKVLSEFKRKNQNINMFEDKDEQQ